MDIAIINGTVVDGTGAPGFRADVGITDDRIVAVGEMVERAGRTIDAAGRIVAPGFIDAHAHSDFALLRQGLKSTFSLRARPLFLIISTTSLPTAGDAVSPGGVGAA